MLPAAAQGPRMICPYCQHELDVETLSCSRCGAEYPQRGLTFGVGLRTLVAGSAMMLVLSLILIDCVLNYLPGGADSTIPTGSAQLPIQPLPDLTSPEIGHMLGNWQAGQQNASQTLPGFVKKGH
jgi:hypothetical protein